MFGCDSERPCKNVNLRTDNYYAYKQERPVTLSNNTSGYFDDRIIIALSELVFEFRTDEYNE